MQETAAEILCQIASAAYENLCKGLGRVDQCIIVSRESGSGKVGYSTI